MTMSQEKCQEIIVALKELQVKCAKTQDNIENELAAMKVELRNQINRAKLKIDTMEKEIAAAKCSWWSAILTLGIACIKAADARNQLKAVQNEFKGQLDLAKRL